MVVGIKSPFEEQAQSLSSGNMIIKHRNLPTIKTIDQEMTRNPETLYELKIFDLLGSEITTLVSEEKEAGTYEVEFSREVGSATGGNANGLSSGTYFYRLIAGDYKNEKKMALKK